MGVGVVSPIVVAFHPVPRRLPFQPRVDRVGHVDPIIRVNPVTHVHHPPTHVNHVTATPANRAPTPANRVPTPANRAPTRVNPVIPTDVALNRVTVPPQIPVVTPPIQVPTVVRPM